MQRLINILISLREYLTLMILIVVSLVLLGFNDNRQIRAMRSYTVGFVGLMQNAVSIVPNVFEMKRENDVLRQLNVNLSNEVSLLREARLENIRLRGMLGLKEHSPFTLIPADVVGKSLLLLHNTITMNAGDQDGIRPDMPIISESGLVGKVIATSSGYSIGQLVLNKDFRASARVERTRVDGIIAWDGGESLHLKNVGKMQDVREGDIVTTSEYSSVFPGGITIGYVSKLAQKPGNIFTDVDVTPSVDFGTLERVFIIAAVPDTSRVLLEKKTLRAKN